MKSNNQKKFCGSFGNTVHFPVLQSHLPEMPTCCILVRAALDRLSCWQTPVLPVKRNGHAPVVLGLYFWSHMVGQT